MFLQVVTDLREATRRLEKQLAEEEAARLEAEENAKSAQTKSDDEIKKLRKDLEKAHEELGKRGDKGCVIL